MTLELNNVEVEEVDIEEYAKADKAPPHAKTYVIRIDARKYKVALSEMTGRELLKLAGKNPPENYALYEKLKGGKRRRIELDEAVSFKKPGVEKFMTLPLDQTEG